MDTQVFVYTVNRVGKVGAWSRYLFPFRVEYTAQLGNTVYLRGDDDIWCLEENFMADEVPDIAGVVTQVPFNGTIWWPWLDMGSPGRLKMAMAYELVGKGAAPTLEFGFDQTNQAAFTSPMTVPIDTVPGQPIPIMMNAPSYSIRIVYPGGGNPWEFLGFTLYLNDARAMA